MTSLEGRGVGSAAAAVRVVGRSLLDWAGAGGVGFKIFHGAISFFAAGGRRARRVVCSHFLVKQENREAMT